MAHDPRDFLFFGGRPARVVALAVAVLWRKYRNAGKGARCYIQFCYGRPLPFASNQPHNRTMVVGHKTALPVGDFLAIVGLIVAIAAMFELGWAVKTALALFGIGLIIYAGRRHPSHALIRIPIAIAAVVFFSFVPWGQIWEDFHKHYPAVGWPKFIADDWFHWALAIGASLALGWEWRPFWSWRHRIRFRWRKALGEETWIDRAEAIKLIRASDWAQMREPSLSILEGIGRGFMTGKMPHEREMMRFRHFINMTLESFERNRSSHVREVDGKKEYSEGALRQFLSNALDAEVIERFGKIPI